VERRYAVFIALSLAAVLGSQVMRTILFPQAEEPPPAADVAVGTENIESKDESAKKDKVGTGDSPNAPSTESDRFVGDQSVVGSSSESASGREQSALSSSPRRHLSLGSLQPDGPTGMLVTLSSRGATVERIELAGDQFTIRTIAGHTLVTLPQMLFRRGVVSALWVMALRRQMLG
jgi:hypothetical protein